jgi:hypothetical protein
MCAPWLCLVAKRMRKVFAKNTVALFVSIWLILSYYRLTRLKKFVSQRTSKLYN